MVDYKFKYFKYKNKYLKLKLKKFKGGTIYNTEKTPVEAKAPEEGFHPAVLAVFPPEALQKGQSKDYDSEELADMLDAREEARAAAITKGKKKLKQMRLDLEQKEPKVAKEGQAFEARKVAKAVEAREKKKLEQKEARATEGIAEPSSKLSQTDIQKSEFLENVRKGTFNFQDLFMSLHDGILLDRKVIDSVKNAIETHTLFTDKEFHEPMKDIFNKAEKGLIELQDNLRHNLLYNLQHHNIDFLEFKTYFQKDFVLNRRFIDTIKENINNEKILTNFKPKELEYAQGIIVEKELELFDLEKSKLSVEESKLSLDLSIITEFKDNILTNITTLLENDKEKFIKNLENINRYLTNLEQILNQPEKKLLNQPVFDSIVDKIKQLELISDEYIVKITNFNIDIDIKYKFKILYKYILEIYNIIINETLKELTENIDNKIYDINSDPNGYIEGLRNFKNEEDDIIIINGEEINKSYSNKIFTIFWNENEMLKHVEKHIQNYINVDKSLEEYINLIKNKFIINNNIRFSVIENIQLDEKINSHINSLHYTLFITLQQIEEFEELKETNPNVLLIKYIDKEIMEKLIIIYNGIQQKPIPSDKLSNMINVYLPVIKTIEDNSKIFGDKYPYETLNETEDNLKLIRSNFYKAIDFVKTKQNELIDNLQEELKNDLENPIDLNYIDILLTNSNKKTHPDVKKFLLILSCGTIHEKYKYNNLYIRWDDSLIMYYIINNYSIKNFILKILLFINRHIFPILNYFSEADTEKLIEIIKEIIEPRYNTFEKAYNKKKKIDKIKKKEDIEAANRRQALEAQTQAEERNRDTKFVMCAGS